LEFIVALLKFGLFVAVISIAYMVGVDYGAAVGWATFFVLGSLIDINSKLMDIVEALKKNG